LKCEKHWILYNNSECGTTIPQEEKKQYHIFSVDFILHVKNILRSTVSSSVGNGFKWLLSFGSSTAISQYCLGRWNKLIWVPNGVD